MRFPFFTAVLFVLALALAYTSASARAPSTSFSAGPLSLDQAQRLAEKDSPSVEAQAAALRAAQQSSLSAGELSDPKLMRRVRQGQADIESGSVRELTKDEALALIKRPR